MRKGATVKTYFPEEGAGRGLTCKKEIIKSSHSFLAMSLLGLTQLQLYMTLVFLLRYKVATLVLIPLFQMMGVSVKRNTKTSLSRPNVLLTESTTILILPGLTA